MKVLEGIQKSTDYLTKKGIESPRLNVELLLAHVLGTSRLQLYLKFEESLTGGQVDAFRELVRRRGRHEPLQHILGSVEFCGLDLEVGPSVLVPRPETEELAEMARGEVKAMVERGLAEPRVLDWGTGSGCLAIAIAADVPAARVDALDISEAALEVARRNIDRHELTSRIQCYRGDSFSALPEGSHYDLIVANPPYVASEEMATLQDEVRDYDPAIALDGGAKGDQAHRRLAEEAKEALVGGGRLLLEFGYQQAETVRKLFEEGGWTVDAVGKDAAGHPRFLKARLPEAGNE